ncbi:MAG TPA: hypothetical protein VJ508_17620, partial [Saprospiraceae bacterium]|nr:hypothetical protein [Saprospiraceae bacterium]
MDGIKTRWVGLLLLLATWVQAQSPHGKELSLRCDACHTSASWLVARDSISFNHDSTRFLLEGRHKSVDCRQCHSTLVFSEAETNCASCHLDIHQQTVGQECNRCHTAESWLVNNIAEIHRRTSFPLLGQHAIVECTACHIRNESELRFPPIGVECIDCHLSDYQATTKPDHSKAGFSTSCSDCHKIDALEWTAGGINHDFFPLTKGHDINDCATCHKNPDYTKISPECITCHETDYMSTAVPNHQSIGIGTDCITCHTTDPGWKPARYQQHDAQFFPIYHGTHSEAWSECTDCHTNPANFAEFTCVTCHSNPGTDNAHTNVLGYSYHSPACLACHPTGEKNDVFDHNNTNFALTGAHTTVECLSCHTNGFAGTPTDCNACHAKDFDQSLNPNHGQLGLTRDCASCHTTDPNWNPAKFDIHDQFYVLEGAHAKIKNDCNACHNGDYNNTPTTCVGCHQQDYDQSSNPSHTAGHFPTDCALCHNQASWAPTTFDHNTTSFPLLGAHATVNCQACHANGYQGTPTDCVACHQKDYDQSTNPPHAASQFPTDCKLCHTETAWAPATFDHNTTAFPLHGAHATVNCLSCHANGYQGTPTDCVACHQQDYDQSTNPPHATNHYPTDCKLCHSETAWSPSSFDHNATAFPLTGAHITVDCQSCHASGYQGTPTACVACHQPDFNQSANPSHTSLGLSTDCVT